MRRRPSGYARARYCAPPPRALAWSTTSGSTARFHVMPDPSIARFRRVVTSAYAYLEARRQEVNDLNVFPVADGDTGDNMAMTMRAVMEELDRLDGLEVDEVGRTAAGPGAGPGGADGRARQLRRDPQPDRPRRRRGAGQPARRAGRPGPRRLRLRQRRRRRLRVGPRASRGDDADRLPRDGPLDRPPARPPRGREAAPRPRASATSSRTRSSPRCSSGRSPTAQRAVERTPEQLEVLRESGVVDAGGYGLVLILAGVVAGLRGEDGDAARGRPPRGAAA